MGTPNREPQEYSRNIIEYTDPGSSIPIIFLLYYGGSQFGVPIKVPLIAWVTTPLVSMDRVLLAPTFWLLPDGLKVVDALVILITHARNGPREGLNVDTPRSVLVTASA